MSTTTPSASSSGRWKAASTTYVAPCSRCAGPNTSPRKLCALIRWSRTVTVNTCLPPRTCGDGGRKKVRRERRARPCRGRGRARRPAAALGASVSDPVAQTGYLPAGEAGHHLGQLLERALAGDQRVEGGVGEQAQGQRHPVGEGAPGASGRGHRADLTAAHDQTAGVERLAQRQAD